MHHRFVQHPPSYVLVENVVGFDQSPMRAQLHDVLASIGLCMQVRPDESLKHARPILPSTALPEHVHWAHVGLTSSFSPKSKLYD